MKEGITFFSTDGGRGLPHRGVFRWVNEPGILKLEKWTGSEWIDWPDLISACGIGGSTEYVQIDEKEARNMMGGVVTVPPGA